MKSTLILFGALLLLFSCEGSGEDKKENQEHKEEMRISPNAHVLKNRATVQERYEDGAPRVMGDYDKENKKHGLWIVYFDNGYEQEVKDFWHGSLHGLYFLYHNNGKKKVTGKYIKGKKVGTWFTYDYDGVIIDQKTFTE